MRRRRLVLERFSLPGKRGEFSEREREQEEKNRGKIAETRERFF